MTTITEINAYIERKLAEVNGDPEDLSTPERIPFYTVNDMYEKPKTPEEIENIYRICVELD